MRRQHSHRPRRRRAPALVTAFACSVLLAACGGEPAAKPSPGPKGVRTPASVRPLPTGGHTELLADVLESFASARGADFEVVYDVTGLAAGGLTDGTFTLVQELPRTKSEFVSTGDGPRLSVIDRAPELVVCASLRAGEAWQCYGGPGVDTAPVPLGYDTVYAIADKFRPAQYYFSFSARKAKILGMNASCVDAKATPETPPGVADRLGTEAELCAAPAGVPLVIRVEGGRKPVVLKAKSYATDVDGASFDPPAAVKPGTPDLYQPPLPSPTPEDG